MRDHRQQPPAARQRRQRRLGALWDFQTGACVLTVPTHRPVLGVAQVAGSIAVGLDAGILVIKANLVA
jgi:hypothetical protein